MAVDAAGEGFVLSKAAMNKLTNGHAVDYGVVGATYREIPSWKCGLYIID